MARCRDPAGPLTHTGSQALPKERRETGESYLRRWTINNHAVNSFSQSVIGNILLITRKNSAQAVRGTAVTLTLPHPCLRNPSGATLMSNSCGPAHLARSPAPCGCKPVPLFFSPLTPSFGSACVCRTDSRVGLLRIWDPREECPPHWQSFISLSEHLFKSMLHTLCFVPLFLVKRRSSSSFLLPRLSPSPPHDHGHHHHPVTGNRRDELNPQRSGVTTHAAGKRPEKRGTTSCSLPKPCHEHVFSIQSSLWLHQIRSSSLAQPFTCT